MDRTTEKITQLRDRYKAVVEQERYDLSKGKSLWQLSQEALKSELAVTLLDELLDDILLTYMAAPEVEKLTILRQACRDWQADLTEKGFRHLDFWNSATKNLRLQVVLELSGELRSLLKVETTEIAPEQIGSTPDLLAWAEIASRDVVQKQNQIKLEVLKNIKNRYDEEVRSIQSWLNQNYPELAWLKVQKRLENLQIAFEGNPFDPQVRGILRIYADLEPNIYVRFERVDEPERTGYYLILVKYELINKELCEEESNALFLPQLRQDLPVKAVVSGLGDRLLKLRGVKLPSIPF